MLLSYFCFLETYVASFSIVFYHKHYFPSFFHYDIILSKCQVPYNNILAISLKIQAFYLLL